jgi:hypothetical protein
MHIKPLVAMKNSQILKFLPALVLVFIAFGNVSAQKLKGKPENFNTPKDYFDQPDQRQKGRLAGHIGPCRQPRLQQARRQ